MVDYGMVEFKSDGFGRVLKDMLECGINSPGVVYRKG